VLGSKPGKKGLKKKQSRPWGKKSEGKIFTKSLEQEQVACEALKGKHSQPLTGEKAGGSGVKKKNKA